MFSSLTALGAVFFLFLFFAWLIPDGQINLTAFAQEETPEAPRNVHLDQITVNSMRLQWTYSPIAPASTFKIQRSTNGTNYSQVGTLAVGPGGTYYYTGVGMSGLSANTKYWYRVQTCTALDTCSVFVVVDNPSYTQANPPSSCSGTAASASQINWSWVAGAGGYESAYASDSADNSGWTTYTQWNQTGLACGTSYTLSVKARNGDLVETSAATCSASTSACNSPPNTPSSLSQEFNGSSKSEGSVVNDSTPAFKFTISDPNSGDTVGYQIQIASDVSFAPSEIDYTWGGSTTNPNPVTYQVPSNASLPDGEYFWRVRAKDGAGLTSSWAVFGATNTADFSLDTTAPPAPTCSPAAGTYTSTQNVSLTSSGSSQIRYNLSATAPTSCSTGTLYSGAISVSSTQTISSIACDSVGNISGPRSCAYTINIDNTNPTVNVTGAPSGWQNSNATASVGCSDSESGCKQSTCSLRTYTSSGSCDTPYTGYANVSGSNPVCSQSIASHLWVCAAEDDNNTNTGFSASRVEFKVDKTAPTITSITTSSPACNSVRFTINGAADTGGSGLAASAYSFNGGTNWQSGNTKDYTGTSVTINAGQIKVRDAAGNEYIHPDPESGTSSANTSSQANATLTDNQNNNQGGTYSGDGTQACCSNSTDCVDNGSCLIQGTYRNLTATTPGVWGVCVSATWVDCDDSATARGYCDDAQGIKTATSGEAGAGEYTNTTATEWCGDDKDEYLPHQSCTNPLQQINKCCAQAADYIDSSGACVATCPDTTAPTPSFTVSPSSGTAGSTSFSVDASASTDNVTSQANLQVQWDWEDDGTYDTTYSTTKTASHVYTSAGTKTIRLRVKDEANLSSTTTRQVTVSNPPADLTVGTPSISGLCVGIAQTLSSTVTNSGTASASGFNVVYEHAGSNRCTYSNAPSLGAGASLNNYSCSYTPTAAGSQSIYAIVDKAGTVSESNEGNNQSPTNLNVTFITAPGTPSQPTFSNVGNTSVTVNWSDVSGESNYRVYRSTSNNFGTATNVSGNLAANVVSWTNNTGLSSCTTYYYWVEAGNSCGANTSPSNSVVTTGCDSTAPSITITGAPSGWQNTNASICVSCSDLGSGCNANRDTLRLYTSYQASCPGTYNSTYDYTACQPVGLQQWACAYGEDNAPTPNTDTDGPIEIKVDKTGPTITIGGAPSGWQNTNATMTVSCSDSGGSGCDSARDGYILYSSQPASCPTTFSSYTAYSTSVSITSRQWVCAYGEDNAGNSATDGPDEFQVDKDRPTISGFSVTPAQTNGSFTISWSSVRDTGGSHLATVELWRAPDSSGSPGTWSHVTAGDKNAPASSDGPWSSDTTNTPSSDGRWWYGIHIVDNAGNCSLENGVACTGTGAPVQVLYDTTKPTIQALQARDGTSATWVTHPADLTITSVTGNPEIKWSASDGGSGLKQAVVKRASGTCASPSVNWSTICTKTTSVGSNSCPDSVGNGNYCYDVEVEDNVGNIRKASDSSATGPIDVQVNRPAADFSLSALPNTRTVTRGNSTTYTVDTTGSNGFSSSVTFSASGLGSGATPSFSPASCTPTCSSTLTISTTGSATLGTFTLTITGTGGGLTRTDTVSLTVSSGDTQAPGISFSPASRSWGNTNASVTITATDSSGVSYTHYCWTAASTCDPGTTLSNDSPFSCSGSTPCSASPTQSGNGSWNLCVRARDTIGNWNLVPDTTNGLCSGTYQVDKIAPSISSFTVDSSSFGTTVNNSDGTPLIAWSASDTGGSGLNRVEIWRALYENNGGADCDETDKSSCFWATVRTVSTASGSWSDSVADNTYWYGIHVIDSTSNNGNCIKGDSTEANGHCGGVDSDSLDVRTQRDPIKVVVSVACAAPTYSVTDPVNASWNTSDTVTVSWAGATNPTGVWGYSVNATCDGTDSYSNSGNSASVTISYKDYICFRNSNACGTTYSEAQGPLQVDATNPTASFTVTPSTGTINTTSFAVDASGSSDNFTSAANLRVRWDWEADGTYDTAYSTNKVASHIYSTAGTKTIRLQVQDSAGNTGTYTQTVTVNNPVDSTPPTVSVGGAPASWQYTNATASVICSDADSGCNASSYRLKQESGAVSCSTTYSQYTLTSPQTVNSDRYYCAAARDSASTPNTGFSATAVRFRVDQIAPSISSFTVDGVSYGSTDNNPDGSPLIAWNASDTGGSGINRVEIWRAPDVGGSPGTWGIANTTASATGSWSDSVANGTYWYGIHVIDNTNSPNGNCMKGDTTHCGGVVSDSLDPRTLRDPIRVVVNAACPLPSYNVTDPVNTNWNTSDTVAVSWTGATGTSRYAQSVNAVCDSGDTYSNGTSVTVSASSQNYVCFRNSNACGTTYTGALGPLMVDTTNPTASFPPPSPTSGTVNVTSFAVDASASSDNSTSSSNLQVRWDWEADGTYDTTYSTTKTNSHIYPTTGTKTIRVQVRDEAGNTATATQQVTVSSVGGSVPDTQITSQPTSPIASPTASFTFTGTNGPTGFDCHLDAGSWSGCSTGTVSYTVTQGTHTFEVRAYNTNGTDASPASYSWLADLTPPTVDAFSINGQTNATDPVTATSPLTIGWTVSDTGGSYLQQAEIWRAPQDANCQNGTEGTCSWIQVSPVYDAPPNTNSWTSTVSNNPPANGNWWYGSHGVDNVDWWADEENLGPILVQYSASSPNPPSCNPGSGTYPDPLSVPCASDSGTTIYYTTEGSDPTPGPPSILYSGSISIPQTTTLKARAYDTGLNASSVVTYDYIITTGINQPPIAQYRYCKVSGTTLQFVDQTSDDGAVTSWSWNFGDSTPASVEQHPAHTFTGGANWFDNSWSLRSPVTLTNPTAADQTNYQVRVVVSYDSDMQADFDDIRFTASNGTSVLDHWLESKTNEVTATFWVEVASLPAAGTTIYLYYGNGTIGSASNGANTFEWFDAFEPYATGSINGQGSWQSPYAGSASTVQVATTNPYEGSQHATADASSSSRGAGRLVNVGNNRLLEARMRIYDTTPSSQTADADAQVELFEVPQCSDGINNDGDGAIDYPADTQCASALDDSESVSGGQSGGDNSITLGLRRPISTTNWYYVGDGIGVETVTSVAVNTGAYQWIRMGIYNSDDVIMYVDSAQVVNDTTTNFNRISLVELYADSGYAFRIDQMLIRKYRGPSSDPSATVGAEEPRSSGPYSVVLTAIDDRGASDTESKVVDPIFAPTCDFLLTTISAPTCDSATIQWNSSLAAHDYEVWKKVAAGSWGVSPLATLSASGSNCGQTGCSYTDLPLQPTTQYSYYVKAKAGANTYNNSTDADVISPPNPECSGASGICSLSATTPPCAGTGLSVQSNTCGVINVSWNEVPTASSYNIYRAITDSPGSYSLAKNTANTSHEDKEILPGQVYYYYVKPKYADNSEGGASQTQSAKSYCYRGPVWEER